MVHIAPTSSEGLDEPAQKHSLVRVFSACTQEVYGLRWRFMSKFRPWVTLDIAAHACLNRVLCKCDISTKISWAGPYETRAFIFCVADFLCSRQNTGTRWQVGSSRDIYDRYLPRRECKSYLRISTVWGSGSVNYYDSLGLLGSIR